MLRAAIALCMSAALLACTEEVVPPGWVHPDCAQSATMELVVLDIWGRDTPATRGPTGIIGLTAQAPISVSVAAPGLVDTDVSIKWSGLVDRTALAVSATNAARVAVSLDARSVDGQLCPVFGVFVGLDHPLFAASGRAPAAGNDVEFLMDGEQLWGRVHADLTADRTPVRVHQSTWWWESDHELIRSAEPKSESERKANTMLALMEARPGDHRVMVARFAADTAPGLAYQNNDAALRDHAMDTTDAIEVISQANPTLIDLPGHYDVPARPFSFTARVLDNPKYADRGFAAEPIQAPLTSIEAASMHQKAMVIDADIAYVSGMNVKNQDWDGSDHRLFDARRMHFDSPLESRTAVMAGTTLPDWEPRKDYGVRIQGPAARQVDAVLKQRWDHARATGELYADLTTPYELLPAAPPMGDIEIQIVATNPEPQQERSILETHEKASRAAKDLILIEDQYWRAPILHEAIFAAMDANPQVHLIVITQDIKDGNGAKKYSYLAHEAFASRYPTRYQLLQIKAFDRDAQDVPIFQTIFLHSKLHIVDDQYLSVGSCNKNNRGYLYEGELNVAIADTAWVADAKARVLANLVGPEAAPNVVGKSGARVFAVIQSVAAANAQAEAELATNPTAAIAPRGIVYPLTLSPDYLFEVGPDLF